MLERRKFKRRSISYYLRIIDADTNQLIGHLADISLKGLKMDSQKPIPLNQEYRLHINTTSDVADTDFIEFMASTRWCELDPLQTGLYEIGFEILRIHQHDREIVQHIMDKYSARENAFNS